MGGVWQKVCEEGRHCHSWQQSDGDKVTAMNSSADLHTIVAAVTMALVLLGLVVALEHNHRRTSHLPRAPFGADAEGDADLARARAELEAMRGRTDQSSGSSSRASHVARRSTAVSNSGWVSVSS